ncbi:intestinal mucin-like protein isoform X1 [Cynoglossus semilaevis]|uniref:intestinal mucin-like protein isoform X1 n=1 Tax=Cynoglossus semilaevis TaxID=244447 RepID=UPI000D62BCF2|nr:intestinal mucin-like protein isoform X1 [Cynoglossus semilaevis]
MVYNVTDGLGWCYVAYCNSSCVVDPQTNPCPTTTTTVGTTTTTVSSTTVSTPSTTSTSLTTVLDCIYENPPRTNGETWQVDNCTTAECINGNVTETPRTCDTSQEEPTCINGRPANKVYNEDGCCFTYECQCVCSGWNGKHYKTFDGKLYDFHKNCTYYLVKEIREAHNLTVKINKHACDNNGNCNHDLIVQYKSHTVLFKQDKTNNGNNGNQKDRNMVFLNGNRVYPAFSNADFIITSSDMVMSLEIAAIKAKLFYRRSSFNIDLSYSLFNGNTEGLCGTCDNSQNNDCRYPNGQVVEQCPDSADQWNSETCAVPTTLPTTTIVTTTTTTTEYPCRPEICDLLSSSVFQSCHSVIPPGHYVETCRNDVCKNENNTCASLEAYATECSQKGVCIDWRSATNGQCEVTCPVDQVYKACGEIVEDICNQRYNEKWKNNNGNGQNKNDTTYEGCYCTNETTLFNTIYDTCVIACDCIGPDGQPKQPGETWENDCKNCRCDEDTLNIQCEPVDCQEPPTLVCDSPYELVNDTSGCCMTQSCECNTNLCGASITCELGYELNVTQGDCCIVYECVPKDVCIYNMTEYEPGEKIPTPESPEPPIEPPTTTEETTTTTASPGVTTTTTSPGGGGGGGATTTISATTTPAGGGGGGGQTNTTTSPGGGGGGATTTTSPGGGGGGATTTTSPGGGGGGGATTTISATTTSAGGGGCGGQTTTTTSPGGGGGGATTTTSPGGGGGGGATTTISATTTSAGGGGCGGQTTTTTSPGGGGGGETTTTTPGGGGGGGATTTTSATTTSAGGGGCGGQTTTTTSPGGGGGGETTTTSPGGGGGGATTTSLPNVPGPCEECYCGPSKDPVTGLNMMSCEPIVCETDCQEGFEYVTDPAKCCGSCVQTSCIYTTPDNVTHIIGVNETYTPPDDPCVYYECKNVNGQPQTTEIRTTCPYYDPDECEPGTETTDANACCQTCQPKKRCKLGSNVTSLEVNGCISAQTVNLTYCAGHCGSSSMYSASANAMVHQCECCREDATSQLQVSLMCENGDVVQHTYIKVESCICRAAECVPTSKRRRRR